MSTFVCPEKTCSRKFTRRSNLNTHYQRFHLNNNVVEKCFLCGQIFENCAKLQQHYKYTHRPSRQFYIKESAFQKKIVTYRYNFRDNEINFAASQLGIQNILKKQILIEAAKKTICKVSLVFIAEMVMLDHVGDEMTKASIPFRSPNFLANASMEKNVTKNISASFLHQQKSMEEFMRSGSNWQFSKSLAFDVEVCALSPIVAGSQKQTIKSDETKLNMSDFKNKKFLYNPSNKDKKCFLYCIAYALYSQKQKNSDKKEDSRLEKHFKRFNTDKISFPISIQGIKRFLKLNKALNIKINILFRDKKGNVYPYEYGLGEGEKIINLLMVCRENNKNSSANHFVLIKDTDKYLRKIYTYADRKNTYNTTFFCLHCLNSFSNKKVLEDHKKLCLVNKPRQEITPNEGENIIKFKNFEKTHPIEFCAFLDFEAVLPSTGEYCKTCESLKCRCDNSYTHILNDQHAMGYSFMILGPNDKIIHEHSYIGENAAEHFVTHLLNEEKRWIKKLLEKYEDMTMTKEDIIKHEQSTNCYLCNAKFSDLSVAKCRDHSHVTSHFLGSACNSCNMRRRKQSSIKIFCHNASRYDMQFIISCLGNFGDEIKNLRVLPFNGENFRTIAFNSFEFLDSLAFLQNSLSNLCSDLKDTNPDYSILKQTFLVKTKNKFDSEKFKLLLQKSYYPYEYCTSIEKMRKTTKMPKRKYFYSSLTEKSITENEYAFAKPVWHIFECKNLLDYCRIYCKLDVVLLAEVFQQFRKNMHSFSGLDPAHYLSLPGYSYDSMLKLTGCKITLPCDISMIQLLEDCKRGGMSFIGTRHLKPTTATDEPGKHSGVESSEIVYIDANVSFL
ncbi:MAG: DNA polymerase [Nanoarchaeota archaeon]|nr:DNA polymerase [Nanoarchaeota archaeon]